jgi:hypothetical protein
VRRHSAGRVGAGLLALALAVAAALLARGVAEAARETNGLQAHWQRGLAAQEQEPPGRLQSAAERLLGVRARNELVRAYLDYRQALASVIEGTLYPQTQARWNAISAIGRLRGSLATAQDRSAADTTLGAVYASSATASGPGRQRQGLLRDAIRAFTRAVVEDPDNAKAKHDLEVLLAAAAQAQAAARKRNLGRQDQERRPTPSPHAQPVGTGY